MYQELTQGETLYFIVTSIITFIGSLIIFYHHEDFNGNNHYISVGHVVQSLIVSLAGSLIVPMALFVGMMSIIFIIGEQLGKIKIFKGRKSK